MDTYCSDVDELYSDEDAGFLSEEDLVFFMQDSDDDEDEEVVVPEVRPKSPVRQLSPSLIAKMEAANVGRLKWLDGPVSSIAQMSEEDAAMFPPLGHPDEKREPRRPRAHRPVEKKRTPVRMRVDFVKDGPYEIKFRSRSANTTCRFVLDRKECPYGDDCKYSHELPLCNVMKNGNLCMRGAACRFRHLPICTCTEEGCASFHPKKEDLAKMRGMKTRMCKNIMRTDEAGKTHLNGRCPSGDACKFAHTLAQVRENVEQCRMKDKCRLVRASARAAVAKSAGAKGEATSAKKKVYKNVPGLSCCWRIHPDELVANFVARTSAAKPAAKPAEKPAV